MTNFTIWYADFSIFKTTGFWCFVLHICMQNFTKNGRFSAQIDRRYEQVPISYRRMSEKEERETGRFSRI